MGETILRPKSHVRPPKENAGLGNMAQIWENRTAVNCNKTVATYKKIY